MALALAGCGGGSNGGSHSTTVQTQTLTGDLAAQSALVSSYQAFQGGVNYPFAQVQATLPNGSAFKAALRAAVAAALQKRALAHGQTAHTGPMADGIGLYSASSTSGAEDTLTFYTDAAETQPVGALTITQTSPANASINPGTYTTYPVDFTIAANVTGGPLPVAGSGTIALTDSAGAGTIQGTFTLPATNVTASASLALADSGDVTGTATVTEQGQTLTLTNLSGTLSGSITGNVSVAPSGDTGTATLNIGAGTFSVTLHTPTGTATASNDSSGNLNITLPSGATETVSSPLTASPTGTYTSTGGGTTTTGGGTSLAYDTPVLIGGSTALVNNSGHIVTGLSLSQYTYQVGVSAAVQTIVEPSQYELEPALFNNHDEVIANTIYATGTTANSLVWATPSASPVVLTALPGSPDTVATGLNDSGEIVGYGYGGDYFTGAVWTSPTATPTALLPVGSETFAATPYTVSVNATSLTISGITGADTLAVVITQGGQTVDSVTLPVTGGAVTTATPSLSGTYHATVTPSRSGVAGTPVSFSFTTTDTNEQPTGVNAGGLIVGISDENNLAQTYRPVYWTSASAVAQPLPVPGGASFVPQTAALFVNTTGQIAGSDGSGHAYFWQSTTAAPSFLPALSGYPNETIVAINASGTVCGYCTDGSGNSHAVIWRSYQVTDLNTLVPSGGVTLSVPSSLSDNNEIGFAQGIVLLIH